MTTDTLSPSRLLSEHRLTQLELCAIFFVIADAATTLYALSRVSGAIEANPVVAFAMTTVGLVPTVLIKASFGSAYALFLAHSARCGYPWRWMHRNWRLQRISRLATARRAHAMFLILVVLHGLVVANNLTVIFLKG